MNSSREFLEHLRKVANDHRAYHQERGNQAWAVTFQRYVGMVDGILEDPNPSSEDVVALFDEFYRLIHDD